MLALADLGAEAGEQLPLFPDVRAGRERRLAAAERQLQARGGGPALSRLVAVFRRHFAGDVGVHHRRLPARREVVERSQGPHALVRWHRLVPADLRRPRRDAAGDGSDRRGDHKARRLAVRSSSGLTDAAWSSGQRLYADEVGVHVVGADSVRVQGCSRLRRGSSRGVSASPGRPGRCGTPCPRCCSGRRRSRRGRGPGGVSGSRSMAALFGPEVKPDRVPQRGPCHPAAPVIAFARAAAIC